MMREINLYDKITDHFGYKRRNDIKERGAKSYKNKLICSSKNRIKYFKSFKNHHM